MWIGAAVQTKTNSATKQHDKQLLTVIMYKDTHKKHQTTNKPTIVILWENNVPWIWEAPKQRKRKSKGEKTHKKQS